MDLLKYIGSAAERIISKEDLQSLGAEVHQVESLATGQVLHFAQGAVTKVESVLAEFISTHPALADEFHKLSADEVADVELHDVPVVDATAPTSSGETTAPAGVQTTEAPAPTAEASGTEQTSSSTS